MLPGGYTEFKNGLGENGHLEPIVKECVVKHHSGLTGVECTHESVTILGHCSQLVCGTNYKVRAQTTSGTFEIALFQALPCYGGNVEVRNIVKL
nr:stefin 1 [Enteromyxum scophthalmi]